MDNYSLIDIAGHLNSIDDKLTELNEVSEGLSRIDDSLQDLVNAIYNLTDKMEK